MIEYTKEESLELMSVKVKLLGARGVHGNGVECM